MRVLVVGGGGREHALCWALGRCPGVSALMAAPGNPGVAQIAECFAVGAEDRQAIVALARERAVDLVVVGPEAPLAAGLIDALAEAGVLGFGPSAAAARLESSKAFAKAFCDRHRIPTARWARFAPEELDAARSYVAASPNAPVVKIDGLAGGKGVVVAETREEAIGAIEAAASKGEPVVLEQRLSGVEASLFALCDGERALPFGDAEDHKRAFDDDRGPNTGGMGAFSPSVALSDNERARAMAEIVEPALAGMKAEGAPFVGFLYVGLMLTPDGPKVIEFNVRMGDPECQAILPRLESDLSVLLAAAARGRLDRIEPPCFSSAKAVTLTLAAQGYPHAPRSGDPIEGAREFHEKRAHLFVAGAQADDAGHWRTSGGRVFALTALANDFGAARDRAYALAERVRWRGAWRRSDIAARAIAREG